MNYGVIGARFVQHLRMHARDRRDWFRAEKLFACTTEDKVLPDFS